MSKLKKTILYALVIAFGISFAVPSLAADKTKIGSIYIPSLNTKGDIVDTSTIVGLGADLWHRGKGEPGNSTYKNVVLAGHRTVNLSKNVPFNNLPSMKKGDKIEILWKGKNYVYEVYETKIVTPTDISIEFNTPEQTLTMYTCVYNFNAKNRFMVRAHLVEEKK